MEDASSTEWRAQQLFDRFVSASTCRATMRSFNQLCEHLQLDQSSAERPLYRPIKRRLNYWRANALWAKLERRASRQEYQSATVSNTTCVVIGAGPCGLRAAVELAFMGACVVLLEKRDSFSRNNVLHLWPFTIHDLRGLGAKKFYGKFCAGSIDHISIRQLQLILLKVALLLGVKVHVNVEFRRLVEPPEDQHTHYVGWKMEVSPKSHPVSLLEFDVIIGADGRRNTLPGFRRKEFRGKLAIAITANFTNTNSTAEAKVEEISGVASIFNQRFFEELRQDTGINLENIVYYKDDTHYFVMTAKKQSLLEKGVILQDFTDTNLLLSASNVDQNALQLFARQAAEFSTNHQLPTLNFALNHHGQPDVAMFDFTCMYASENAAMVRLRHGHQLLATLVGDSLLEPFWPMGTGVARGFLAALDSCWMIGRWCRGETLLDVLAERESVYRLLPQTTPENMQRNISLFSLDPTTRYVNLNPLSVTPAQVRQLVDTGEEAGLSADSGASSLPESFSPANQLLMWCQVQTSGYRGVCVSDLTTSWKSGLALCALIHRYRPDLIDFDALNPEELEENTRLGFHVSEKEFGISPPMTVKEMLSSEELDSLSMVMYLSQFQYQLLQEAPPSPGRWSRSPDVRAALVMPASILSRLGRSHVHKRNLQSCDLEGGEICVSGSSISRVRLMANQLQAKLDESSPAIASHWQMRQGEPVTSVPSPPQAPPWRPRKRTQQQEQMSFRFKQKIKCQSFGWEKQPAPSSSTKCFFCQQRVYVMERLSAEGVFFHRSCFRCVSCSSVLRPSAYVFHAPSGRFSCLQHECLSPPTPKKKTSALTVASSSSDYGVYEMAGCSSVCPVMEAGTPERSQLESDRGSSSLREALHLRREGEQEEEEEEEDELEKVLHDDEEELEEERGSDVELNDEEYPCPLISQKCSTCGGSDIGCLETDPPSPDTQMPDSFFSLETPPPPNTPSTTSFITMPDSCLSTRLSEESKGAPPALFSPVVDMDTAAQRHTCLLVAPWGHGSFDDISPEVPQTRTLACARRPCSSPHQTTLRSLQKAPPLFEADGGGARALWNALTSVNRKKVCDVMSELQRTSIKEEALLQPMYVPHALAFKRAFAMKRHTLMDRVSLPESDGLSSCPTETVGLLVQPKEPSSLSVKEENMFQREQEPEEENLDAKMTKRIQRAARRQARQEELRRLHRAQVIQRKLQQVEEKQRQLEEKGVMVEKSLRGEGGHENSVENLGLMQQWFQLVQQRNVLVQYESELMIFARELELEDRLSRLQQELREKMTVDDHLKEEAELLKERSILEEMLKVVEQRDALVSLLEEHKLHACLEDQDWQVVLGT